MLCMHFTSFPNHCSSADELDLANLPFHDQSKFSLRIPHTQDYVDERAVRRLVGSENQINNPADWFTELSHLFLEGQVSTCYCSMNSCLMFCRLLMLTIFTFLCM